MDDFSRILSGQGTDPLLETVAGSYACQRCSNGIAYEATFNIKTKELVWTSDCGHRSYVEECSWL